MNRDMLMNMRKKFLVALSLALVVAWGVPAYALTGPAKGFGQSLEPSIQTAKKAKPEDGRGRGRGNDPNAIADEDSLIAKKAKPEDKRGRDRLNHLNTVPADDGFNLAKKLKGFGFDDRGRGNAFIQMEAESLQLAKMAKPEDFRGRGKGRDPR